MYNILENGKVRVATLDEIEEINERSSKASLVQVPKTVTSGQGKEALFNAGLFHDVQPAIDEIEDSDTKWRVQNAWDNRPTWERQSPFVLMMAGILGLSEEEADQLFIDAAKL